MENANLYEEGAMDCVKAFHKWQLTVPLNNLMVPYDVWRAAWIATEEHHAKETRKLTDQIEALCIDLEVKRGNLKGIT